MWLLFLKHIMKYIKQMDEGKNEWMKSKNSFYSSVYTNQALRVDS